MKDKQCPQCLDLFKTKIKKQTYCCRTCYHRSKLWVNRNYKTDLIGLFKTKKDIDKIKEAIGELVLLRDEIIERVWFLDYNSFNTKYRYYTEIVNREVFTSTEKAYIKKTHKWLKEVLYKI